MRLCIFFPSKSEKNVPSEVFAKEKSSLKDLLASKFGGLTEYETKGCWRDGTGALVEENVTVLEIYIPKRNFEREEMVLILTYLKDTLEQDSVAYSIDGEIYFIPETIDIEEDLKKRLKAILDEKKELDRIYAEVLEMDRDVEEDAQGFL